MNTAKRVTLATAAGALLLTGAGVATAAEDDGGGSSTQSPGQLGSAVSEILKEGSFEYMDALNGDNRPDGANGVENEFPPPDPRYVEGPAGGLLNGPQD